MIDLLKAINDKDKGYDLAGIGADFDLFGDKPCEFVAALQEKYFPCPKLPKNMEEFEKLARPLIKYIAENFNPHTSLIIDATSAEIVEGQMAVRTQDYLVD